MIGRDRDKNNDRTQQWEQEMIGKDRKKLVTEHNDGKRQMLVTEIRTVIDNKRHR